MTITVQIGTQLGNPVRTRALCDGGDNPCTSSYPMFKRFWWTLLQGDYEKAAAVVTDRVNANHGSVDGSIINYCFPIDYGIDKNCANISSTSCIMNVYYNQAMTLKIPEFDPSKYSYPNTQKTTQKLLAEAEEIIKNVALVSGQAYFMVKEVLYNLYYATYADSASRLSYQYIAPLKYKEYKETLEKPADVGSAVTAAGKTVAGTFDDVLTIGKWVLILGGAGAAIYFLAPLFTALKK